MQNKISKRIAIHASLLIDVESNNKSPSIYPPSVSLILLISPMNLSAKCLSLEIKWQFLTKILVTLSDICIVKIICIPLLMQEVEVSFSRFCVQNMKLFGLNTFLDKDVSAPLNRTLSPNLLSDKLFMNTGKNRILTFAIINFYRKFIGL